MATRSQRKIRRYSTILALGLMTALSSLVRVLRSARLRSRAR